MTSVSPSTEFHTRVRWMALPLVVATLLFGLGAILERGGEAPAEPAAQHADSAVPSTTARAAGRAQQEANGADEAPGHVTSAPATDGDQHAALVAGASPPERPLGINLENPWLVDAVMLGSLLLAAGLLRFGQQLFLVVLLVTAVMTLLDGREVLLQLDRAHRGIALVSGTVLVTHAAVAVLAVPTWRTVRPAQHRPNRAPPVG